MHHAPSPNLRRALAGALLALTSLLPAEAVATASCQSQSGANQALLLELYTSEGCNSCPPADRWLSSLKPQGPVLAAAFHVDYWDRLGWVDRFGSPRHTERQAQSQRQNGARFSYTPQVVANGRDWRGWPTLPSMNAQAQLRLALTRQDAQQVQLSVTPLAGAPAQLGLWWALLEDGHVSQVKSGENQGASLHHDHVVRFYRSEPDWAGSVGLARSWRLAASASGEQGRPVRLLVVVTDASTGAPLQALQLAC